MDWLFKITMIWLSLDVIIFATCWYGVVVIKPRWPGWWKQVVADIDPESNIKKSLESEPQPNPFLAFMERG